MLNIDIHYIQTGLLGLKNNNNNNNFFSRIVYVYTQKPAKFASVLGDVNHTQRRTNKPPLDRGLLPWRSCTMHEGQSICERNISSS